jgi:DNA-binding NarL/FixJ family response regulator
MNISIMLADECPVIELGLRHFFESRKIEIVCVPRSSDELIARLTETHTHVLVSETRIANDDTLGRLSALTDSQSLPPIVFFAHASDPTSLARALAMGAYDYVAKSEVLDILEMAIRGAAAGKPADATRPLRQRRVQLTASRNEFTHASPLTKREMQVLTHIAMGLSNREIGMSLGITMETTKEHVQNILRKLDVNDRTQAAIWALRRGLI